MDAANVRRSTWPNIAPEELVVLCRAWAAAERVHAVVVFDGAAPTRDDTGPVELVSTGAGSADDWIADEAARLGAEGAPHWLVTSDRELRERAGTGALRTIGGGSLARTLLGLRGSSG